MKILLFGANGQLGWELCRALAPLGDVMAVTRHSRPGGRWAADFEHPADLTGTLAAVMPDVIVNAAAYTAVDAAESDRDTARRVNADAPAVMARWAATHGARLVHYSTDYVFDGSGDAPRDEDAPTGPLSVYGHTKLQGEQAIRASGCRHLVMRTSWVHAPRGRNFAHTMIDLAATRNQLKVVDDQIGAPTGAELLADATAQALTRWVDRPELGGTYHLCAAGYTSWHGYACRVIERARAAGRPVMVGPDDVLPVPSSAFPTAARRPANSRLDCRRFRYAFGLVLPPWEQGVDRLLDEILA